MMSDLHADHFFLGVDGLDAQTGPSTPGMLEAQLNGQMLRAAREVSVLADATKFGRRSLSLIGEHPGQCAEDLLQVRFKSVLHRPLRACPKLNT